MTQAPKTCNSPDTSSNISGTEEAQAVNVDIAALLQRLEKRAKEDEACAANSRVVADLLAPEMAKFKEREDAGWNTYAVRVAVDHKNSVKRDASYAADLRAAIATIASAREVIEPLRKALQQMVANSEIDGKSYRDSHKKAVAAIGAAREWKGR